MATPAPHVQVPEVLKRRKCFLHIDLEQIRLGLSSDVPLVSQQWNAIIAVNYAARKFGIKRLEHSVFDAKQLFCAHVATLGPGDSQPDYHPSPSRYTHKVSLDPYRKASAKIFNVFRKHCSKYQKGGLDEVFMDITDIVNKKIMDEYGHNLSKWDQESAQRIDWKRDHAEAGVVFGMPRDGSVDDGRPIESMFPDEDDEDKGLQLDGIRDEENDHEMESDVEDENDQEVENENEREMIPEDDFDFDIDLEQYLDSDFDDMSSYPQLNHGSALSAPDSIQATESSSAVMEPQPGAEIDNATETSDIKEKSEEELIQEKQAEMKRLQLEMEQLLPYYGIPEGTFEEQFWEEMQLLKAAEYCSEVRQAVWDELGYTCSAGVANNRLLAKLGSGMNKPFQQTIVLPKYVPHLLHGLKLSKIRNLGGKFGKQIKTDYNIERASQLWPVPLRQLQERYGSQAGLELWQWCRGIDHVGIRKIKSKSMGSHKSFIPALSDLEEIQFWITTMCLELVSRMQAEFDETERWPRTISLGYYGGKPAYQDQQQQERSSNFRAPHRGTRSMPMGSRFEYGGVEGLAKKMYSVVEKLIKEAEARRGKPILPLVLLDITVSNFSDGGSNVMGDITKFFSKAPAGQSSQIGYQSQTTHARSEENVNDDNTGSAMSPTEQEQGSHEKQRSDTASNTKETSESRDINKQRKLFFQPRSAQRLRIDQGSETSVPSSPAYASPRTFPPPHQQDSDEKNHPAVIVTMLHCEQCPSPGQQIPIEQWEQHKDYHFALNLQEDDRRQQQMERQQQQQQQQQSTSAGAKRSASPSSSATTSSRGRRKKSSAAVTTSAASNNSPNPSMPLARFFKPNT
ncbi:DNA-directed DNA polymerase eta rad30 [Mortierella polycephala]|uniref:DNA polymerase eta n=1 Tax=Mortierella polycephala TaxID=41804 RepID=A0A9P6Q4U0_9FUNG|nr:DNA-directed DNA polymerase eta rad30 [Mortierella polycephala]